MMESCICGSNNIESRFTVSSEKDCYLRHLGLSDTFPDRTWFQCKECSLGFSLPRLHENEIIRLYQTFRDDSLRGSLSASEYFTSITSLPKHKSENYRRLMTLQNLLINTDKFDFTSPISLLDIGSGGGIFLNSLQVEFPHWMLHGLEPTKTYADFSSSFLGISVHNQQLDEEFSCKFKSSFDLVCATQVFEHAANPQSFFHQMVRLMKNKQSFIFIEVPDIIDLDLLAKDHGRFLVQHQFYHSIVSLDNYAASANMHVLGSSLQKTYRGRHNLSVLIGYMCPA